MCRALDLFLTHKQCVVETEQVSSIETGQVSALEKEQGWGFIDRWEAEMGFHSPLGDRNGVSLTVGRQK